MTTLDKAIRAFGFEDPRTITIAYLEESGQAALADRLYATLVGDEEEVEDDEPLYYNDEWDEDEEYLNGDEEMGFDPYEGCYTFDC